MIVSSMSFVSKFNRASGASIASRASRASRHVCDNQSCTGNLWSQPERALGYDDRRIGTFREFIARLADFV